MTAPEIPSEQDDINAPDLVGEVPKEPISGFKQQLRLHIGDKEWIWTGTEEELAGAVKSISRRLEAKRVAFFGAQESYAVFVEQVYATKTTEVRG